MKSCDIINSNMYHDYRSDDNLTFISIIMTKKIFFVFYSMSKVKEQICLTWLRTENVMILVDQN